MFGLKDIFGRLGENLKKIENNWKSISDSLLYPSKEQYIVKELGDKWEMLGLSLDDILGVERKKGKKMPEIPESEGGDF